MHSEGQLVGPAGLQTSSLVILGSSVGCQCRARGSACDCCSGHAGTATDAGACPGTGHCCAGSCSCSSRWRRSGARSRSACSGAACFHDACCNSSKS